MPLSNPADHLRRGCGAQEAGHHTDLLRGFLDTTLPADQFHHAQHVEVAWWFVRDHGMPTALGEFTAAIKRFAAAKSAHGLYHETITWAFLLIIAERQARTNARNWEEFAAAHPDLLVWKPSILNRYYSKELLASDLATRTFVMPDMVDKSQSNLLQSTIDQQSEISNLKS